MKQPAHPTADLRDKMRRNLARIVAMERQAKAHGQRIHAGGRQRLAALNRDIAALQRQLHAEDGDVHTADLDLLERMLAERKRLETLFSAAEPTQW